MNTDTILLGHRLFIDNAYEEVAKQFCNLAGQETTKTRDRFILSNWYEGYLFCLLLGIKRNDRATEGYTDRIDKAPKWSLNYLEQYKYAISCLLSKVDILNELNLLDKVSIASTFVDKKTKLDEIKKICDEYAIGGLRYLNALFEKDDRLFDEPFSLKEIYKEALQTQES